MWFSTNHREIMVAKRNNKLLLNVICIPHTYMYIVHIHTCILWFPFILGGGDQKSPPPGFRPWFIIIFGMI